jgi:antitoxin component of RelBE/YafQ-DinJ toxin-antitoxin module
MNKTEVLTIRIDEELGKKLSVISEDLGITRADYIRMVLKLASTVDTKELIGAWESGLKQQILHP